MRDNNDFKRTDRLIVGAMIVFAAFGIGAYAVSRLWL